MSEQHDVEEVRRVAEHIADTLGEKQAFPRRQILAIVHLLGPRAALDLLEEAKRIQASGGLWLPDRSRRRTFGGVFFYLARQRLGPAWPQIYQEIRQQRPPRRAPFPWKDRATYIVRALRHPVEARDIHIVVRWRQGEEERKVATAEGTIVVLSLALDEESIPHDLPRPDRPSSAVVLIPREAKGKGPTLIARGIPQWHSRLGFVVQARSLQTSPRSLSVPARAYVHVTLKSSDIRWTAAHGHVTLTAVRWQGLSLLLYVARRMWRRAQARVTETVVLGGQVVVDETHVAVLVDQIHPPRTP